VHHRLPFHERPDLELSPDNLMTLCEAGKYGINCHLLVGHLGNWRRWNPFADQDALLWRIKLTVSDAKLRDTLADLYGRLSKIVGAEK
jgi:hypothetical protein